MLRDRTAWRRGAVLLALAMAGIGLWLVLWPTDSGVPDEFADRPSLADCGGTTAGPADAIGKVVADVGRSMTECFDGALAAGTGAELTIRQLSVEGTPAIEYHRALPDGGVEVFIDSRGDSYASQDWVYFRCPEARNFQERGECEFREL